MSSKKDRNSPVIVRCYEVGSPTRHRDGFTIYKVTQQIIHVDALEKSVVESFVWKRYSDFNKLYKSMFMLHKALQRREEFPDFVRAQVFNRFEQSVIEERRRSAQDLLNFVGQRHYLVTSPAFKQFFQHAEVVPSKQLSDDILQPSKPVEEGSCDTADASASCCSQPIVPELSPSNDHTSDTDAHLTSSHESLVEEQKSEDIAAFGGMWQHLKRQEDNISSGDGADDDDETEDPNLLQVNAEYSNGANFLNKDEIAAFDVLLSHTPDQSAVDNVSNVELLSSVDTVVGVSDSDGSNDPVLLQKTSYADDLPSSAYVDSFSSLSGSITTHSDSCGKVDITSCVLPRTGSVIESGSGDLTASPVRKSGSNISLPHIPSFLRVGASLAKSKLSVPWKASSNVSSQSDGQAEYITEAAELISQAQEHEMSGNHVAAFGQYKCGIGILLKGVQKDSNHERRDAVRMKTEKYLIKAEELYHKHLSMSEIQDASNRWHIENDSSESDVDEGVALLRAPIDELKAFKVIGVINGVQLVVDTTTESTFVVKVLHKTCSDSRLSCKSIVPTYLPYVVNLVKFYETESAIYMLLQHAGGGRLWSYVGSYLNQCFETQAGCDEMVAATEADNDSKCVYLENCQASRLDAAMYESSDEMVSKLVHSQSEQALVLNDDSCLFSRLSISEFECSAAEQELNCDETASPFGDCLSPLPDSVVTGFDSILKSTKPDMNCFSIGSFDSAHASRQPSCCSDTMSSHDVHAANCSTNDAPVNGITEQSSPCSEETSIYDKFKSTDTADCGVSPECKLKPTCLDKRLDDADDENSFGSDSLSAERKKLPSNTSDVDLSKNLPPAAGILRMSSQENTGRKRSRTLSSTFGELDVACGCGSEGIDRMGSENIRSSRPQAVRLPESCVRQWAAEMVIAVSRLHSTGIICRDLRPANVLLGDRGHILLTYFSRWNTVDWTLNEQAVENLYCAPEVSGVFPVTTACDWWSIGALLYELLTGQSLRNSHPAGITSHTTIYIPDDISPEAQSLLCSLLQYNPIERLGGGPAGSEDVRSHPFFNGIQWNHLLG